MARSYRWLAIVSRVGIAVSAALLILASTTTGLAQQSDAESTALARSLFQEALEFADNERWDEAAERYRRVLQLRRSAPVMFNLAEALVHLGHVVEAAELLRQIERDQSVDAEVRDSATRQLAQVEPRVGRLTIRLTGHAEAAVVTLDGTPVEAVMIGVAAPVDPGRHVVAVQRADLELAAETVEIAEGATETVTLEVPPPPAGIPSPREAAGRDVERNGELEPGAEPSSSGDVLGQWWFWTAVGVLVVGAIVVGIAVADDSRDSVNGDLMPGRLGFGG